MSLIIKIYTPEEEDSVFEFQGTDYSGGVIYHYQGKPFTGIIRHYTNNILMSDEEFTNGHIGGVQRDYYPNGKVKQEYYKYFGKLDLHFKEWDENGNLISYSKWEKGIKTETII
ncbi:MAG: hypothetical protein LBE92_00565 [Chryseobacterium sp.]|jgi:antitoxin component YwqK of YwqJK toxin-antitoxin module|uniref:hypothetical protein n=1 Tax=Chryseobacterium sp. TaxID=1871047 RepID=UPI002816A400|nr:hypothetical protein [Chryseobacterium sp.]MDR2234591.1 hypothetical protein [Chryseobacterium sp.]